MVFTLESMTERCVAIKAFIALTFAREKMYYGIALKRMLANLLIFLSNIVSLNKKLNSLK